MGNCIKRSFVRCCINRLHSLPVLLDFQSAVPKPTGFKSVVVE